MKDVDAEALGIKIREELATFQASLLSELSTILAKQQEHLLNKLVPKSNAVDIAELSASSGNFRKKRESIREGPPRAEQRDSGISVTPSQEPKWTGGEESRLLDVVDQTRTDLNEKDLDNGDGSSDASNFCHEDVVKVKMDAAFGSIFTASALDSNLEEVHYHVEDFYSHEGVFQALARNEHFSNLTLGVISLNAVYIGVDADWNSSESLFAAHPLFIFMDNAFCVFFSFELLVRFMAFKYKRDCVKDGWFRFDCFLVAIMVAETWIMAPLVALMSFGGGTGIPVQPLRLLRLLRLTRMTRLMRSLPELVTMTKGMAVASRAVLSSLMMVALLIYTFAIVLNMAMKEKTAINEELSPRNFSTIPQTMWTLLMDGTFMDSTGAVLSILLFSDDPACWASCLVFMMFILFSAITVMNMLVGVLCEVVSAVAQAEKDDADIRLAKQSILVNLKNFAHTDGTISLSKLMHVFNDKEAKAVLKSLNIDRLFLLQLQQLLFPKPDSAVPIKAIMEVMLMCRGELPVTVQHIASAQAALFCSLDKFEEKLVHRIEGRMVSMDNQSRHEILKEMEQLSEHMSQHMTQLPLKSSASPETERHLEVDDIDCSEFFYTPR